MGSNKTLERQPSQAPYRDEPQEDDRAETASMASAVLLDNIESYPEDEPPAYSDVPDGPSENAVRSSGRDREIRSYYW